MKVEKPSFLANIKIDAVVKKIMDKLLGAGYEVSIVGGGVKDLLLGKNVDDWDLTTNAKPDKIQGLFKKSFYNNRFGTVGVPVDSKKPLIVQITTYRSEEIYLDRRRPQTVTWGTTLVGDLKRRDFTINAMALKYEK